jgi:hypothetical protein
MHSPHSPQLLPSNLSTHHSSETTHSNPSTYLSTDRLPSNLYILFIYIFKFQDIFFTILVHLSISDTSPMFCIVVRILLQQFNSIDIYLGLLFLHRMASEIQLLLLKNTAAPPQEYSCSSSRVSRQRQRQR